MRTTGVLVCSVLLAACGSVSRTEPDAAADVDAAIDAEPGPSLTSLAPTSGIVTTEVTLRGAGFGAADGTHGVTFAGVDASIVSWSDDAIVARVPDVAPGATDVTVTTARGTSDAQSFRVILPPRAYLQNDTNDTTGYTTVSTFAFDPATGALAQVGDPLPVGVPASGYGGCSSSALVHERTRRLFVSGNRAVAVLDIDPVTGAVAPVAGSPFAVSQGSLYGLAVTAAGDRLFVADYDGRVAVLDVGAAGALTPVAGSPFAAAPATDIPMLARDERFLYVNTESDNRFAGLAVAPTGALTPLAGNPFEGSSAFGGAMRPGADQFFIPDSNSSLKGWSFDPSTGAPTPVPGTPLPVTTAGGYFHFPAFTPDGARLYVGMYSGSQIFGFALDAAGTPTPLAGSPWSFSGSLSGISCMAVTRDAGHLVVVDEGRGQVAVMRLDAAGTPTHVTGSPFAHAAPYEDASGLAITF